MIQFLQQHYQSGISLHLILCHSKYFHILCTHKTHCWTISTQWGNIDLCVNINLTICHWTFPRALCCSISEPVLLKSVQAFLQKQEYNSVKKLFASCVWPYRTFAFLMHAHTNESLAYLNTVRRHWVTWKPQLHIMPLNFQTSRLLESDNCGWLYIMSYFSSRK